jgi:hypothetical protein
MGLKPIVLAFVLVTTALQHVEPPKGWECSNHPKTPAEKLCKCHRTCALNTETGEIEEKEDPACKVYCFKDSCACLSECDSH